MGRRLKSDPKNILADYLTKPFSPHELKAGVKKALESSQISLVKEDLMGETDFE